MRKAPQWPHELIVVRSCVPMEEILSAGNTLPLPDPMVRALSTASAPTEANFFVIMVTASRDVRAFCVSRHGACLPLA
jgi:hypothetical protein